MARTCVAILTVLLSIVFVADAPLPMESPRDQAGQPTAEEVIARHVAAVGGLERLQAVETIVVEGKISGVAATAHTIIKKFIKPNFMRQEVDDGAHVLVTDGSRVWSVRGDEWIEYTRPNPGRNMNHANLFNDMLYYREKGTAFEYVAEENIDRVDLQHLRKIHQDGSSTDLYFSVETGLLTLERSALGGHTHQVSYFNYREVEGILFPFFLVISYDHLHPPHVLWVESIRVNIDLAESLFEPQ